MKFFLLAAGYGKRAEPLSLEVPKPLFPLSGMPLLTRILDQLCEKGINEGFINLHHLGDQIPPHVPAGIQVKFLPETALSGSRILSAAVCSVKDCLLVVNGDVFLEIPVEQMRRELNTGNCDGVLLVRPASRSYPRLNIENGTFQSVIPPSSEKKQGGWMYCGVSLFTPPVLNAIDEPNFFSCLMKRNFRIRCLSYRGIWLDIGTPRQYFLAAWRFERYRKKNPENILSEKVSIHRESQVTHSILWKNTQIDKYCRITDSVVTSGLHLKGFRVHESLVTSRGIFPMREKQGEPRSPTKKNKKASSGPVKQGKIGFGFTQNL